MEQTQIEEQDMGSEEDEGSNDRVEIFEGRDHETNVKQKARN